MKWILELTFYALFGVVVCWMFRNAPFLWCMDVENASVSVMFAFDDKMDKMIRDYLTWDTSVENMCAKNISREDYQKKQLAILDAMGKEVGKTKQALDKMTGY